MYKETRRHFETLTDWRVEAVASGLKVKLITKSKGSHYYQAISTEGEIKGYFVDWQPGNKSERTPGGLLS